MILSLYIAQKEGPELFPNLEEENFKKVVQLLMHLEDIIHNYYGGRGEYRESVSILVWYIHEEQQKEQKGRSRSLLQSL